MKTNLLKSIFISLILLVGGISKISAATVTFTADDILFFNMSAVSWWTAGTNGDGNFAYFYNNSTDKNAWSAHAVQYSGSVYYVKIPAGTWEGVILTRNNTSTAPSWNNKWNQTGDIALSSTSNYISKFSENSATVTWGTQTPTSTGSLAASATSVNIGSSVTLTPSLTSNTTYNEIKSTSYSISPSSGASISSGKFTATQAGTYTVTATVTYNPRGYSSLTSTVSPTVAITVKPWTITWNANGGSVSPATSEYDGATAVTLPTPTRTGYDFDGWYTAANGGTKINDIGTTTKPTSDVTYYAHWTPKTYAITLDANGGESNGSATVTYNSNTVTITSYPTRTDYRCEGYLTAATDGTLVLNTDGTLAKNVSGYTDANGNWIKDEAVTLYAQWTYDVTEYTVTFGAGTGFTSYGTVTAKNNTTSATITSPATVRSGQSITFTATPETGYEVEGWYTNAECTTGKHNAGKTTYTTTITAATNVYVKFVEKTWFVSFAATTGGTVEPSATQTVGEANGITVIAEAKTGYTFNGWTSSNGGTFADDQAEETIFYPTAATTVTASFTENLYAITVKSSDNNHGTVSQSTDKAGIATSIIITAEPKEGYRFVNWTTATAGITIADATDASTTVTATATGTVTANFEKIPDKIVYLKPNSDWKLDGARFEAYAFDGGDPIWRLMTDVGCNGDYYYCEIPATYNKIIFVRMNPSKPENDFGSKWNQTNDLTIQNGEVFEITDWNTGTWTDTYTAPTYNINTTDGIGGTIKVSQTSGIAVNEQVEVTMNANDGYTFQSGTIKIGNQAEQTISTTTSTHIICGPTTITATWKPDSHTVTFDAKGHGTAPDEQSVDHNEKVEEPKVPTANGYTFGGWYTDADCTNAWNFNTDVVTADMTLYAKWTPTEYNITYNALYGVTHSNPETYTIESETITFTNPTSERTGYTFAGWNPTKIENGSTGNQTVTAQWTINNYDINYITPTHGNFTIKVGSNTAVSASTTADYNTTITLANNPATGYHFGSWDITPNDVSITSNTFSMPASDVTIGVIFAANTYKVKFNKNADDATGSMSDQSFTYDEASKALTANAFTRTGYTFDGWNTKDDGTGEPYTDGQEVQNLTADNNGTINLYAQWTEILSTITITTNPAEGGKVTVDDEPFTPGNTVQVGVDTHKKVNTTPNEGYGVTSWEFKGAAKYITGGNTVTLASDGSGEVGELIANYIPLSRNIKFDKQSGEGGTDDVTVTYTQNNYSVNPVIIPTRSGYTFGGYYSEANGAGVQIVSAVGEWLSNASDYTDANGNWLKSAENTTLYAQWTANTYTVTLQHSTIAGYGSGGTSSVSATYDAAMPSATMPTAANGYVFMGYFDGEQGAGTQYYDADGTSAHVWNKAEDATLYAHFVKAEITQITLDKYTFEPVEAGGTGFVTATPTIEPTPTNDVILCWRLLYNNGNPVAGRDAQVVSGNSVQFSIAGLAAGTYKIEAVLRTGNNCGSGEVLSTKTINFSIASTYTITVKYTCDGKEIMAASKVPAHVSEETEITAPNITGYTFSSWEAGDGVTIKSTNNDKVKITAIYDGYLTAKYTARPMVYFKNTLGWKKVYVYTFWDNAWWNDNGTGVHPATNKLEQGEMTQIGETDIYYFALTNPDGDYTQNNNANLNYIAFSNVDYRNDNGAFRSGQAIYRGDHKEKLTLFVPQKDQTPETHNSTKYYSKGIWMEYNSTESGYQLAGEVPSDDPDPNHDGWGTYGNKFTAQQPGDYIFTITKHLEANTTYKFKIKNAVWIKDYSNKDNNQWFGYEGTISNSTTNWLHFKGDNDEGKNNGDAKITTTAAGEYTFTIDLSQGKVLLSVEYPIEVGDYRVIYKDNATWSKGTAHDANWYHPSRIIKKNKTAEPTKDIISFFISYGQNTTMQFQRVKSITNGKVTWEDAGEARIPDAVNEAGVYNFIVTQTANGASISMEDSAEPYTGNYYIRVDALAGKWDNYKTNPENRMIYSAFSESEANSFGEKFSHYATKYCTNGTNIKFTIANDYSPCISDTLVQDVVNPLGNLDSEGTLLSNDMYNANVRFMWYRKTNMISRAYVGPAGEKHSQFLMLRTKDEIQGEAENETLNTSEGDILDAENSIYAARFADTQNWMYERTVRVKPGTRVKLYASYPKCYHIYVENNTGWSEIALYAWKDGGDQPLGEWPGLSPIRTVEINGKTYHDFQVNEWVFGSKLILNNNNNGLQKEDFDDIVDAGNYYLSATTDNKLTKVEYVANVTEANAQYFRGAYDNNNATWNENNSVVILGGSGDNWNKIRVIYDFKTNRLMAALVPDQEVSGEKTIAADVMIIRQHQNPATSITLANDASKMTQVKTVYGSLQLNRWVLNNRKSDKSGIEYCTKKIDNQDTYDENVTNEHHPVLSTGEQKSIYERALYFISFPFDVHLSDVFGFGTYGTHWVISDYNGLRRAQRGYFAEDCINEDCTNWDYIWDPSNFTLKANQGYLLSLDLDLMRYDNTDFWLHNIDQVELFFPSTANLATIEKTSYTMPELGEEYLCKINHNTDGATPDRDRRVKDSYWRCIGVPSFADYDGSLYKSKEDAEANEGEGKDPINWKDNYKWTAEESGFPFLYEWNVTDNSLSVQNTSAYQFKPTFAYLVQNGGAIHWKAVNSKPSSVIARQRTETARNYEWKIALMRDGNQEDQTFVRITDNENVTTDFDFNQDLAKEFNYGRGDIYTLIGYERVAANSMPCSDKTTIIPLGLNIEQAGDYTIAMPEGVENIGITLVDNQTGIHTNLSAGQEYTLTLNNGICENRLFIEVSPIQNTPTDLEYTTGDTREQTTRKMLIDGILYLIRDGVIYDAQGHKL